MGLVPGGFFEYRICQCLSLRRGLPAGPSSQPRDKGESALSYAMLNCSVQELQIGTIPKSYGGQLRQKGASDNTDCQCIHHK